MHSRDSLELIWAFELELGIDRHGLPLGSDSGNMSQMELGRAQSEQRLRNNAVARYRHAAANSAPLQYSSITPSPDHLDLRLPVRHNNEIGWVLLAD